METDVEIGGAVGDAVVMRLKVRLEQRLGVLAVGLERLVHGVGAEVGERGVVDLDVAAALVVEGLELLLVRLGEVGEEVLVVGVGLGRVALARGEAQVEVAGGRHGELALAPLLLGDGRPQELPVVEVGALLVADLALADGSHGVLLAGLLEGGDRGRGQARVLPGDGVDLAEALELLEEAAEVPLAVELAGADGAHAVLLLLGDDVGDGAALLLGELRGGDGARISLLLRGHDGRGADEGADLVGVEGELCGAHGGG